MEFKITEKKDFAIFIIALIISVICELILILQFKNIYGEAYSNIYMFLLGVMIILTSIFIGLVLLIMFSSSFRYYVKITRLKRFISGHKLHISGVILSLILAVIGIQATTPLIYPKVSMVYIGDEIGKYYASDKYLKTSIELTVRPPLFPLSGWTDHQDINFGHKIHGRVDLKHPSYVIDIEKLEDERTIRVHVHTDGWRWDELGDVVSYEYNKESLDLSILPPYVSALQNKTAEGAYRGKNLYYQHFSLYNEEDFPVIVFGIEREIVKDTEAWNVLYNEVSKNTTFEVFITDNEMEVWSNPGCVWEPPNCEYILDAKNFGNNRIRIKFEDNPGKNHLEVGDTVYKRIVFVPQ